MLFERKEFGIISREKYLKEYLLCSQFQGTVLHTIDVVIVSSNSIPIQSNDPSIPKFKNTSAPFEILESVHAASCGHPGPCSFICHLQ